MKLLKHPLNFYCFIKKHLLLNISILFILFIYLFPRLYLGANSYITIIDTLDGGFFNIALLANKWRVFDFHSGVASIMNGIPRVSLYSGCPILVLLFSLFKPFSAYIINELIVHLTAFLGMFFLLKTHFIKERKDTYIALGISLCFSVLPFYTIFGLSIVGQPLLLFAFLNLRNKQKIKLNYLIIAIFALYSNLVLVGIFICFGLLLWLIIDFSQTKKVNLHFFAGLCLLGICYFMTDFKLILAILLKPFISQRSDFIFYLVGFKSVLISIVNILFFNTKELLCQSFHPFILAIILFSIVYSKTKSIHSKFRPQIIALLSTLVISIILQELLMHWQGLERLKEIFPFITLFTFRIIVFSPLLWYLMFGLSLALLRQLSIKKSIIGLLIGLQFILIFFFQIHNSIPAGNSGNYELLYNWLLVGKKIVNRSELCFINLNGIESRTYQKYCATPLFQEIDTFIGKPKNDYKIGCIGFPPIVATYYGFHTLDAYLNFYPLQYKRQFGKIIEKEVQKSSVLINLFNHWGNKCYFFVDGLYGNVILIPKDYPILSKNLHYDITAFKKLGGRYFLSTIHIKNAANIGLKLEKVFVQDNALYQIFLYRAL